MLRTLIKSLRDGVVTSRYPDEPATPPERFRGAPEARADRPLPPASICPTGAITAGDAYTIDLARCIFCGRCGADPEGGIQISRDFELASRRRDGSAEPIDQRI